jgi:P27 family predicted phage terminase small subunit
MRHGKARTTRDYVSPMASYRLKPGAPEPPEWLDPIARAEFLRVIDQIEDLKILSPADATSLAIYAEAYKAYYEVSWRLRQEGVVLENGQVNPLMHIQNQCASHVMKCGSLFGLSPKDRGTIRIKKPDEGETQDAFDDFANNKKPNHEVDGPVDQV